MTHSTNHTPDIDRTNNDASATIERYRQLLDYGVDEADIEQAIGEGWTLDELLELNREAGF